MRCLKIALLTFVAAGSIYAQQQAGVPSTTRAGSGATSLVETGNLPAESIGRNDLIGITVYDSPELTRTVRVDSDGTIRLPMLKNHIRAAGLYPEELENAIKAALVNEEILVDPIVTVSVVEYRSRPINVSGAVRNPMTFQATGGVTLLDAISEAGGLTENAGSDILVVRQQPGAEGKPSNLIQRIPVSGLIDSMDPSLNLRLEGGDVVRVPGAGSFYVLGNVKGPGVFPITNGSESSVLKALALTHGLDQYSQHVGYIFRTEGGTGGKSEIPVQVKKILDRKSPDVPLMANDILYIPEASGRRATIGVLRGAAAVGLALFTTLLYLYH